MRIAVTGAAGFLGREICRALVGRGSSVTALVRGPAEVGDGVQTLHGDALDPLTLDHLLDGADAVVHAAGLVRSSDEAALQRTNVDVARAVAERAGPGRFVLVSSAGVHGSPGGPLDEGAAVAPGDPYERSKAAAEGAVRALRPDVVLVRPTNVLGVAHPRPPLVRFMRSVAAGRVWTSGAAWANYVAVEQVAEAVAACAMEDDPPRVLLVNEPMRVVDLAGLTAVALGVTDRVHVLPGWLGDALRPALAQAERAVPALHRVRSAVETTRFASQHGDWLASHGAGPRLDATLRAMVADYRERGLL